MGKKNIVSSLIDETSAKVLDNIHKTLKLYKSNKKEADKILKYMIKTTLKLIILNRNDQFSREELDFLHKFVEEFQKLSSKVISFYEDKSIYDKYVLQNLLEECRVLAQSMVDRHLTSKSKDGINLIFNSMAEVELLDAMFNEEAYEQYMGEIVAGLKKLKGNGKA